MFALTFLCFYTKFRVARKPFSQDELVKMKQGASSEEPVYKVFHERLKDYLKKFLIIGGMPEAVHKFINDNSNIKSVQRVLSDITTSR